MDREDKGESSTKPSAEQALRESEERLRAIVSTAVDGIVTIDDAGTIEWANPAVERIFGYELAQIVGKNVHILMPEPYHSEHDSYLTNYERTGIKKVIGIGREVRGLRKDGSVFPLELSVSEVPLGDRKLFTGIIRDITDRKRVDEEVRQLAHQLETQVQALKDSEERMRAIVSTAVDGILTIDEQGTIEWANAAAERIFGFSANEMRGQNVKLLMPEPYRSEHDAYLEHYRETGERRIIGIGREVAGRRRDGSMFPIELAVSEVHLENRRLFTGIVRDVSARKAAEDALRRLAETLEERVQARTEELLAINEQLQGFSYSIAHDLRQHIRGIVVNAQLILHENGDDLAPPVIQRLDRLILLGKQMGKLTEDILAHAKLGRDRPLPGEIDMSALAEEAAGMIRERYRDASIEIEPGMRARGDPSMIRLVIENLLDNACKYSKPNQAPVVRMGLHGSAFFVCDQGMGFEMKYAPKVFEAFERLEQSKLASGSGIGLANVKRIVEKHRGEVWVESEMGKGSTFYFRLPD